MRLKAPLVALALAVSTIAASAGSITEDGVTFTTTALGGNQLQLTIEGALSSVSGTGCGGGGCGWDDANFLQAFSISGIGNITGASLTGWSAFIGEQATGTPQGGLGDDGCEAGGGKSACFSSDPPFAIDDSFSFVIQFAGDNLNFSAPHLKVRFLEEADDTTKVGSLLSQNVPGPIVGAGLPGLIMACGGLLALARRRRQMTA